MTITTGTEKQIAWATDIKRTFMEAWREKLNKPQWERDPRGPALRRLVEIFDQITDAEAWIDCRYDAWRLANRVPGMSRDDVIIHVDAPRGKTKGLFGVLNNATRDLVVAP